MLEASGISQSVIEARGYRTVSDRRELLELGFKDGQARVPGLLVPIRGIDGSVVSHQFRPDEPRQRDGKPVKYETPQGARNRLDVPPTMRERVLDPHIALYITEGVKKADSAASRGIACIALSGVWNWRGKDPDGKSETIPDLDSIPWRGRDVRIVYDSDATTNPKVKQAEAALSEELRRRGARVRVLRIPPGPTGEKVGLDDFLAAGGRIEDVPDDCRDESKNAGKDDVRILDDMIAEGLELWKGAEDGDAYATVPVGTGAETLRVDSQAFAGLLARAAYDRRKRALSEASRKTLVSLAVARALFDGNVRPVALRVWSRDGTVYWALHDREGRVVQIDRSGWRIVSWSACPVRFAKGPLTRPLPEPRPGGGLTPLWRVLNVSEPDRPLVAAWLAGCFLPVGELPLLALSGPPGSGKTTALEALRSLVDPSEAETMSLGRDPRDLVAAASGQFVVALDNLSRIGQSESDLLCRLATGGGIVERRLYTNYEAVAIKLRRPVMLNGIGDVVQQPDLADRSLAVLLEPLAGRVPKEQVSERLEAARPSLLGELADRVSRALAGLDMEVPDVRLIDFARFALAACPDEIERAALRDALVRNRADMARSAMEDVFASALLGAVVRELKSVEEVRWTSTEVLRKALEHASLEREPRDWPRSPSAASGLIGKLTGPLAGAGVLAVRERDPRARWWVFRKICKGPSSPSFPSSETFIESEPALPVHDGDHDGDACQGDAAVTLSCPDQVRSDGDDGDDAGILKLPIGAFDDSEEVA